MLILSNHLKTIGMEMPEHYVTRINVAWVRTEGELDDILLHTENVFLDYPTGRYKPPFPIVTLQYAILKANEYTCVNYFAVSNAEKESEIHELRQAIRKGVTIVPKIETEQGVSNLFGIVDAAKTSIVMLDKDDLYMNIGKNNEKLEKLVHRIRKQCDDMDIVLLELAGVVFHG